MGRTGAGACLLALGVALAAAQSSGDSLRVYTEHPRLFLRPARLRLLTRERERRSLRWTQFETLMAGKARMPEPGFAGALYYRVAQDREAGRRAVTWALGPAGDLRQIALVFDWCQDLLSESESRALIEKLQRGIERSAADARIPAVRSRLLAALALGEHAQEVSEREIERVVRGWWDKTVVPALKADRDPVPREDVFALLEILHTVRDNLNLDLRDSDPGYFRLLPVYHLITHYPASYPAGENEYRIPAARDFREPDLERAALSRAAELSIVAYDANAPESNILQGWLMHDAYLLRSPFGIAYEFLWANPYQPGLSYYHVPLVLHDTRFGRLIARSTWEEDATWFGSFEGATQLFEKGKLAAPASLPVSLPNAYVIAPKAGSRYRVELADDQALFCVGLKPRQAYHVEVDGEEMREMRTDTGGSLRIPVAEGIATGFRLAPYNSAAR